MQELHKNPSSSILYFKICTGSYIKTSTTVKRHLDILLHQLLVFTQVDISSKVITNLLIFLCTSNCEELKSELITTA